ncbi:hypothetical protein OPT61_g7506 [Boeremia exigua]|uniref:Uncharacterized protein n=1 Tax=Boeremia exigua TaxID=749465 RepID=A0ACC2I2Z2_9PLEO|nr:hypothetical protein OPT61_g7506 [Boeremia exigua]
MNDVPVPESKEPFNTAQTTFEHHTYCKGHEEVADSKQHPKDHAAKERRRPIITSMRSSHCGPLSCKDGETQGSYEIAENSGKYPEVLWALRLPAPITSNQKTLHAQAPNV